MARIRRINSREVAAMEAANLLFGEAFGEEAYQGPPASRAHLERLLQDPRFIALVAQEGDEMVGSLAAYELVKFEADCSEIYIYDLAVREELRRRGIATALIGEIRLIARELGAWVIFVQADPPDAPAVALYEKLGKREEVFHFDISPSCDR